jgi:hypothetical protein
LFVGAGFSRDAKNKLGEAIPDAGTLAALLWEWADLEGKYDNSPLSVVYQAALTRGKELASLRAFLEDRLLATEIPSWYFTVSRILWHRVYGTNADNVVEAIYRESRPEVDLEIISSPTEDYRERDQFLRRIQYVKLHGSLPGDPRRLTFGTLDYASRANAREDWWHHFVRDYVFQPTLFVGTQVDEPLFWQSIEARRERGPNPEERPRSYLVVPSISPARKAILEAFNILHVPTSAKEFFDWLAKDFGFPPRDAILAAVAPELASILSGRGGTIRLRDTLSAFLGVFPRVPLPAPNPARPKLYFRGAPPTWEDIVADFDAPREFNTTVLGAVEEAFGATGIALVAVLGEGGAGKSTVLRRVSLVLRQGGREVFFSDGASRMDPKTVREALEAFPERSCVVMDNASLLGMALPDLVKELAKATKPPVVLLGARYIPFEQRLRSLLEGQPFIELDVPILTKTDIDSLLATLERHAQLGHLAKKSIDDRRYEFAYRSKKQILVALREATEGAGFDQILQSEYSEIESPDARILFLSAALGTAALIDLSEKQWFACSNSLPSDALRMMRRDLRGMVDVFTSGRERYVAARHPVIAECILDRLAERWDVMEAYGRVLLVLSRDIYPGAGRRNRSWRLFTRLVSHQSIYERFGEDLESARGVFELASSSYASDGHFWLQYASLEIEYGLPAYARSHLANAEGLLGETELVLNTRAHMILREAEGVEKYEEALRLRREAEDILLRQMERVDDDDEYPFHVYLTHMLRWVRQWSPDRAAKRKDLESLLRTAQAASDRMPTNRKLKGVLDAIKREYLSLAVAS